MPVLSCLHQSSGTTVVDVVNLGARVQKSECQNIVASKCRVDKRSPPSLVLLVDVSARLDKGENSVAVAIFGCPKQSLQTVLVDIGGFLRLGSYQVDVGRLINDLQVCDLFVITRFRCVIIHRKGTGLYSFRATEVFLVEYLLLCFLNELVLFNHRQFENKGVNPIENLLLFLKSFI